MYCNPLRAWWPGASGTWAGEAGEFGERWDPKHSNLVQVLVSIQGLVLVDEPYYNEPGFEKQVRLRGCLFVC